MMKRAVPAKRAGGRRAFEEVCDQIRRDLAAGILSPGDRLPAERIMAEQFGVGRAAVREALRMLEMSGVILTRKGVNGGPYIRAGNPEMLTNVVRDLLHLRQISADSIFETRILLTNDAIRLACERGMHSDFDAIERDIDRCEQLAREGRFNRSAYIVEFYNLLAKATHNEVLLMLVNSLSELQRQLLDRISPQPRRNVIQVRRRVLAYLRSRNAASAIAEMTAHLKSLARYMKSQERPPKAKGRPICRRDDH